MRDLRGRRFQRSPLHANALRQLLEDTRDLGCFIFSQLHQTIIQIDGLERLHEHRLSGSARSMNHAGDASPV